jgi:lipopolysaccharide exporter
VVSSARPTEPPAAPGALAAGAVRGAGWNILTFGATKGLLLLTTVVLARVLEPTDFGLLALGLLLILFFDVVGDLGVGAAVIYRRGGDARSASTAVLVAGLTGALLTGVCLVGAPVLGPAFDEPRLPAVVQALSLGFLLRTLSIVHRSMLEKELDFARRAVPEVVGAVTKAGLSIGLALGGLGVWSLVWGQVAGVGVTTVLYWWLARWSFRFQFDVSVARDLLGFGIPVTLLALLAAVTQALDQLIIGARLDAADLGQYSIGYRLPEFLVLHFCYLLSGALFPSYAKANHDPDQLRRGFRSTLRLVSVVTTPVALGLAITAGDLVPLLFGDQWGDAVPVMRWLAVAALLMSLCFNVGDVYKATGQPGVLNKLALVRLAVSAPVLWFVAPSGVVAVAAALAGLYAANTLLYLLVGSRMMRLPLLAVLSEFVPAAVAGAAMVAVLLPLSAVLDGLPSAARLALVVAVGAVAYVGALAVVSRATVQQFVRLLLAGSRRSAPATASTGTEP